MRSIVLIAVSLFLLSGIGFAQTKPKPTSTVAAKTPSKTSVKPPAKTAAKVTTKPTATAEVTPIAKPSVDMGKVVGRTYTNETFGFEVTFPDEWLIPDSDFEAYMKKQGFDLSLKAPDSLPVSTKTQVNKAIRRVNILLTAYRSMPGSADNAIVRISVEDLAANPQIEDAVDYFDAIRATYATMKLPADFKYSETGAEKLGPNQFGYLDADSNAGKKRMYATVRNGYAIMFTISYKDDTDLNTLRLVLERADMHLGKK
ncbi:hypothetical protein BH10ACI2_BH10ACI2_15990 [soil metagenome]